MQFQSRSYEAESVSAVQELYHSNGWTDGLPIVPPTEEAVKECLDWAMMPPDQLIGVEPVRGLVEDDHMHRFVERVQRLDRLRGEHGHPLPREVPSGIAPTADEVDHDEQHPEQRHGGEEVQGGERGAEAFHLRTAIGGC